MRSPAFRSTSPDPPTNRVDPSVVTVRPDTTSLAAAASRESTVPRRSASLEAPAAARSISRARAFPPRLQGPFAPDQGAGLQIRKRERRLPIAEAGRGVGVHLDAGDGDARSARGGDGTQDADILLPWRRPQRG